MRLSDRPVLRESLSSQRSWTYSGRGARPEYRALPLDTPTQQHMTVVSHCKQRDNTLLRVLM